MTRSSGGRARTGLLCCLFLSVTWACSPRSGPTPTAAPAARAAPAEEAVVNVYNWFDYIQPELLRSFEAKTGIRVHYDVFDSNNTLESKLLAGHSGYDVVFPSGAYLETLIAAGVFGRLDRARLPGLRNLDPALMQRLAEHDPGNAHAVIYTWGITGLAYDAGRIARRLPDAPVDSWSLILDPKVAAHFADCGIGLYESPNVIVPSALAWLGADPNSEDPQLLERAGRALLAVRPFIRKISSNSLVDDLANGQLCIIIASNGDAMQAQERTRIAANGIDVRFTSPREGAALWIDVAAIPADAPHVANAHRFIEYLLDPAVAAANSNAIHFATGNQAAQPLLRPELRNENIYPQGERAAHLFPERAKSEAYVRLRTRMWTRFRTGR